MSRPMLMPAALSVTVVLLAATPARGVNILVNGGFDTHPLGTGWTQILADPLYPLVVEGGDLPSGVAPQSAPAIVWLGGILSSSDAIYQDVNVPVGADKLALSGYVWIRTDEFFSVPYDHGYVELVTPAGALLEVLRHWTNVDKNTAWAPLNLQASGNYGGSTIRVRFRTTNDDSYATSFLFDTFVLDATSTVAVETSLPTASRLVAVGPNPTRAGSRWRLDLAAPKRVHASVYDIEGRLVRHIKDEPLSAGSHELAWDGTDAGGRRAGSGVYVCVADVGGHAFSQRIVLIH